MSIARDSRTRAHFFCDSRREVGVNAACNAPTETSAGRTPGFLWPDRVLAFVVIAISLLTSNPALAQVVEGHCDGRPNVQITCDKTTNGEWLDLTETRGMSVAQVLASDFVEQGFRYALESEIQALWTNAGIPPPYPNETAVSEVESLHELLGITFASVYFTTSNGIYNVGLHCSSFHPPGLTVLAKLD